MSYSVIAPLYDRINGDQYAPYAAFLKEVFSRISRIPVKEVLDLGCGTGSIAALLAEEYDMVALDVSPDMLSIAMEKNAGKNTLLLCQDMRNFELYGTVQGVYSSFDCLNYLKTEDLGKVFSLVHNYLEPGGVFVFDVNTRYRLEQVYGENAFTYEYEEGLLLWRNEQGEDCCHFVLDWFELQEDGSYERLSETQTEYIHDGDTLIRLADENGFEVAEVLSSADLQQHGQGEKAFYVLIRK